MKIMDGQRLRTTHPVTTAPVPVFVDDLAPGLRTASDDAVVLTVDHDPRYRMPVLTWSPRIPTDPAPWRDTANSRRHASTEARPHLCDYCDQPATRRAQDCDDVLCVTDARDQYARWREATRPLSTRDVTERQS